MKFIHQIPEKKCLLGIVVAQNVETQVYPASFEADLEQLLVQRKQILTSREEGLRAAARNMLRNGSYKPTGRGKPASEYLLAAAQNDGSFPRINSLVDVNNFMSLQSLLPISLWDIELAQSDTFLFRLGLDDERYVFNAGGQTIGLKDLVLGCKVTADAAHGFPIVNPIKDSMATKTKPETRHIAAAIYAPNPGITLAELEAITAQFAEMLRACSADGQATWGILAPENTLTLG